MHYLGLSTIKKHSGGGGGFGHPKDQNLPLLRLRLVGGLNSLVLPLTQLINFAISGCAQSAITVE